MKTKIITPANVGKYISNRTILPPLPNSKSSIHPFISDSTPIIIKKAETVQKPKLAGLNIDFRF